MRKLLSDIADCTVCSGSLPFGPRPVVAASSTSKILVIGQAPGTKVHASGIPWDDASGNRLREWMDIDKELFYDSSKVAIVPMGFCYPGRGKSGDLPPRPECAPLWHDLLLNSMPEIELTLLIGTYAQQYYLKGRTYKTLTETVRNFDEFLPQYFPLPHPSPRNNIWLKKNSWFENDLLPEFKDQISRLL